MSDTTATMENAKALAQDIIQTEQDINSVITPASVSWHFKAHYTDLANGDNGCKDLICSILLARQAVFARHAEETALRPVVVATAMFADDIFEAKVEKFGKDRYPRNTIHCDLNNLRKLGIIQVVKLKKSEDPASKTRPRRKFYLLDTAAKKEVAFLESDTFVNIGMEAQ